MIISHLITFDAIRLEIVQVRLQALNRGEVAAHLSLIHITNLKSKLAPSSKFGAKDVWILLFEVTPIIRITNKPAEKAFADLKIKSHNDKEKLAEAKKLTYEKAPLKLYKEISPKKKAAEAKLADEDSSFEGSSSNPKVLALAGVTSTREVVAAEEAAPAKDRISMGAN
ncbi:hypothetical protein J5N97_022346 [Dioscorea zingiberensis]|uniref:Uncharacterized protein n=1 Tax=Dioscorea zingiberensis TaxID=325984 RepID=A0A9D5HAK1_9LILI|nr:hypothetical protein J5N97_022346 [Dioscorea zingiberensis]